MSGLMNLFGSGQNLDNTSFQYDPSKQRKAPVQQKQPQQRNQSSNQQQSGVAFQSQVQLFHFDTAKNENQSYGVVTLCIQKTSSNDGYQLLAYKEKDSPFINIMVTSAISWVLRNKIYVYLKEPNGIQWTITFPDQQFAARACISIGAILSPIANNKVSYFDIVVGNGPLCTKNDNVSVAYMGFSGNNLPQTGSMFDSNENYNFVIGANNVIKGYSIGCDQMKVGGIRVVLIPPDYGYGAAGAGNRIPPNATLSFIITLNSSSTATQTSNDNSQSQPQQQQQQSSQPPASSSQISSQSSQQQNNNANDAHEGSKRRHHHHQSAAAKREAIIKEQERKRLEEEKKLRAAEAIPTADEEDILNKIDQLSDLIQSRYDSLVLEAPVPQKDRDLVSEVQALAAQIAGQEIKLRKNKEIIEELQRTKRNARLRAELDIVQTELTSLKATLKGGMDFRKENEELKEELRNIREGEITKLHDQIADIRVQIKNEREISRHAVNAKAKELFYQFIGSAIENIQATLAKSSTVDSKSLMGTINDVFMKCQIDVISQIDQGMLPPEEK